MTTRTIYTERIPWTDPRLKRRVHHDSLSRRFPFPTEGIQIGSVTHQRVLPILNQQQVGKCTAEAGCGALGTEPYYSDQLKQQFAEAFGSMDDQGTDRLYSAEETIDGDGPFPPQDNGSSGLTLAKALRNAGLIAGWWQVFGYPDLLKALQQYPVCIGIVWLNSMFDPDSQGILRVDRSSGVAGGHELVVVGYDSLGGRVLVDNSWGTDWGVNGTCYITDADMEWLLGQQGDGTIFTPGTQPAPTPTPQPTPPPDASDIDIAMAAALRHNGWVDKHHIGGNAYVAHAGKTFLLETGL